MRFAEEGESEHREESVRKEMQRVRKQRKNRRKRRKRQDTAGFYNFGQIGFCSIAHWLPLQKALLCLAIHAKWQVCSRASQSFKHRFLFFFFLFLFYFFFSSPAHVHSYTSPAIVAVIVVGVCSSSVCMHLLLLCPLLR